MIDFSENKKGNFHKAGRCFAKTFVFLFLGIAELIKSFWYRLTKRGLLVIALVLLVVISMCWLFSYMHMKVKLTTAEWQYDSLKQKVDSMHEINSRTAEYSRIIQQQR
jgi:hypothetical protein